jgi:superfamily I DNA/RNA helicase
MTSGERRLAQRLEDKLDGDYLLWYDVPVGPTNAHPDFVVLHPSKGLEFPVVARPGVGHMPAAGVVN